ncbi:MAG TPA: HAD-IIB family hydrolase [Acidobacteriaceae bacterium]|nr:HAD-IIB family hydrolase [Acidobacteriaceae bacterium]
MRPCLIAVDIDGTLLNSQGQVSPRNRAALHLAQDAGVEIVVATGRRHAYAMRVLRDLNLNGNNALISSNGTVLRTIGADLIHRTHLPVNTARWLCTHAAQFRDQLVFTFDNVGPDGEDRRGALVCESTNNLHNSIGAWMRANEPYIAHVERIEQALAPASRSRTQTAVAVADPEEADDPDANHTGPIQAMLCGTIDRMAEAEALLASHPTVAGVGQTEFPGCEIVLHRTAYPDRDLAILDILPAGCSKASALEYLAVLRGCTLAETIAVGDNWNDLPMLQAAGRAILMGNAPDDLKGLAQGGGWQIGPTNDEDGVAVAIEAALG